MFDNKPKLIEATFFGASHKVEFGVYDNSHRRTVRDTMGDDVEEWRTEWRGWVTVRTLEGECLAACKLGIPDRYDYEAIHGRIYLAGLVPGMEAAYADFIGKKVMAAFKTTREKGIPVFALITRFNDWKQEREVEAQERQELLEAGLILDEHGQRTLALK